MPILNRAAEMQDEIAGWRRHLHRNPELNFDVFKTADFVDGEAEGIRLRRGGRRSIGRTGVVGVIRGRLGDGRTIGLRADMDALPIAETTRQALRLGDARRDARLRP